MRIGLEVIGPGGLPIQVQGIAWQCFNRHQATDNPHRGRRKQSRKLATMTLAPSRLTRQHLIADRMLGIDFAVVHHQAALDQTPQDSPDSAIGGFSSDKLAALTALRKKHDASCPHCTAVSTHTQTVFGEGDCNAQIMFIGEAPGEEEDRTGRPFVGRAGQKLDEIIKAMGLSREQVYIANILKSRPPENRTPLPNEIDCCAPYLAEQIRIIQPKVLVSLGNPSTKWLLKTDEGITRMRGRWGVYRDGDLGIPVMPTYHPAYVLRNYTVETRKQVWSDMQQVLSRINAPK